MSWAPRISLCHTTARLPDGWRMAAASWRGFCDRPDQVEHVLAADVPLTIAPGDRFFDRMTVVQNRGRRCAVDGWNAAARASRGKLLISVSDDWFPPLHWDTLLLEALTPRWAGGTRPDLDGEHVLEVSSGGNEGLLTFSILTRAYFNRLNREYGYAGLFAPDYLGMWGDDDFDMFARRDGVVIDAKHLYFHHEHPLYGHGEMDEVHRWQHREEAFATGARAYRARRRKYGFKRKLRAIPRIVVCLPGENYSAEWVMGWTQLLFYLAQRAIVLPINSYASNVYVTRASLAAQVKQLYPLPDFVLWLDDDNLLSAEGFMYLLATLLENPELDAAAGWCWVQHGPKETTASARISAGMFDDRGLVVPLTLPELFCGPSHVRRVEYSGFPAVLMHADCLEFSDKPFRPVENAAAEWGMYGEDVSFWLRSGAKVAVDRRVEVPHLKRLVDVPAADAGGALEGVA